MVRIVKPAVYYPKLDCPNNMSCLHCEHSSRLSLGEALTPMRQACAAAGPPAQPARRHTATSARWFAPPLRHVLLPLLLLAGATALFRLTPLDLSVSRLFYGGSQSGWSYNDAETYRAIDGLFHYGPWPGLILGIGGLLIGLLSLAWPRWLPWRQSGFFLGAMLILGPGLMVNGVIKPWFQRPRPCHIQEFGGDQPFVQVLDYGTDATELSGRSFPSGHASMGFYLMAPAFLLYRRHPRWAGLFLGLGLVGGCLIGAARIAQGDHFASDVLWAGGMVYFSGLVLGFLWDLASRPFPPPAAEDGSSHDGSV